MSTPVDHITNAAAVTSVFGRWPSFHDAEVLGVELVRRYGDPAGPGLVARIHAFSMTDRVDGRGYFILENHSIVVLRFDGIEALEMDGFNHQNALNRLGIAGPDPEGRFEVHLDPAYGVEARFTCRAIEVVSITPGLPPASVHARAEA